MTAQDDSPEHRASERPAAGSADVAHRLDLAEQAVGHRFADRDLLRRALTHASWAEDVSATEAYERLEFLGDAVLGFVVVDEVYRRYPDLPEGTMTRMKVGAVSGTVLVSTARQLGLADLVLVGPSETATGGRGMDSVLEDAFEALVGAIYLDGGLDEARGFVLRVLGPRIAREAPLAGPEHPKSALQELTQAQGEAPAYEIVAQEGPVHERVFTAEVRVGGRVLGRGTGRSKKEAETSAADAALRRLEESR